MNTLKSALAALIVHIALVSAVNAAPNSTVPSAPNGATQVSGSIAKYINFTKTDTSINLGDMGGPTFGLVAPVTTSNGGAAIRYFESAAPAAELGKGQKIVSSVANTSSNRVKGRVTLTIVLKFSGMPIHI